jgi:hypothetical protein
MSEAPKCIRERRKRIVFIPLEFIAAHGEKLRSKTGTDPDRRAHHQIPLDLPWPETIVEHVTVCCRDGVVGVSMFLASDSFAETKQGTLIPDYEWEDKGEDPK